MYFHGMVNHFNLVYNYLLTHIAPISTMFSYADKLFYFWINVNLGISDSLVMLTFFLKLFDKRKS